MKEGLILLVLLDQENVAHHGLVGIEALRKTDKIVTFIGKEEILPPKLQEILEENTIPYEIHESFIGTKNAVDYQLISFLTYAILNNYDKDFLIVSRDKGFDISIKYLKKEYPKINICRMSSIFEFILRDFLKKDVTGLASEALKVYDVLAANILSNKESIEKEFIKEEMGHYLKEISPYIDYIREKLIETALSCRKPKKKTVVELDAMSKKIFEATTPQDTYNSLAQILEVNEKKNYMYLKSIRRAIISAKSFQNFKHRILSNATLLEMEGIKRCEIPERVKIYFRPLKVAVSKKG